jgi:hypothetical protein
MKGYNNEKKLFILSSLTSTEPEGYIESDSVMNRPNLLSSETSPTSRRSFEAKGLFEGF